MADAVVGESQDNVEQLVRKEVEIALSKTNESIDELKQTIINKFP